VAVVAILALGLAAFGRRREPPSRPDPGDLLLSIRLAPGEEGASGRFRLAHPGAVEVSVDPPEGASVEVSLGPPRPPSPDGRDLPAEGPAWTAKRGDPPKRHLLYATGLYVVRVEPRSSPPPPDVGVTVRAVPPRN
jgi:hypothetical protein